MRCADSQVKARGGGLVIFAPGGILSGPPPTSHEGLMPSSSPSLPRHLKDALSAGSSGSPANLEVELTQALVDAVRQGLLKQRQSDDPANRMVEFHRPVCESLATTYLAYAHNSTPPIEMDPALFKNLVDVMRARVVEDMTAGYPAGNTLSRMSGQAGHLFHLARPGLGVLGWVGARSEDGVGDRNPPRRGPH